jgi:hypothetical protein
MTYTIGWSYGSARVETAEETGAVLDRVATDPRGPLLMHVAPGDDNGSLMELVWGHPDRAMVMYADNDQGGWGVDPSLPPLAEDLDYNYGSVEPARTRVTAAAARKAVQEYVTTGKQPTNLSWFAE